MSIGPWICDECGEEIKTVDKGYVLWDTNDDLNAYGFKIIHQKECDRNDQSASGALEDFLGDDGVAHLLTFLSCGPIKKNLGQAGSGSCRVQDFDEFVDFFRRVQTPFYEQARVHFKNHELLDDRVDDNELGPYVPSALKKISEKY